MRQKLEKIWVVFSHLILFCELGALVWLLVVIWALVLHAGGLLWLLGLFVTPIFMAIFATLVYAYIWLLRWRKQQKN